MVCGLRFAVSGRVLSDPIFSVSDPSVCPSFPGVFSSCFSALRTSFRCVWEVTKSGCERRDRGMQTEDEGERARG
jgi:hypothetical protein